MQWWAAKSLDIWSHVEVYSLLVRAEEAIKSI